MLQHSRRSRRASWLCAAACLAALAGAAVAKVKTPPPIAPPAAAEKAETPPPAISPAAAEINRRLVGQLVEFLTSEYSKQLCRPGWLNRAAGLIGLSRLPTAEATRLIFEQLHKEKHAVAQLVAWQAILSRAPLLTDAEFRDWEQATHKMMGANQFQGNLRIGLLEMLSTVAPTAQSRAYFSRLFDTTNSLDSRDIPTLVAMGKCLRAWGDAKLVKMLLDKLSSPATAFRAELVLRAAGAGGPWANQAGLEAARLQYHEWWKQGQAAFTSAAPRPEGWHALQAQFLPPVVPMNEIDRSSQQLRKELELGELGLALMGLSVNIDCSRSMHLELERLKRDICVMMAALTLVAKEPRIGITLFTTGGATDTLPLTNNPAALVAHIGKAHSAGKGTEEEWAGGLEEALARSNWGPLEQWNRRVIIIISDEPMLNWQFDKAMPTVKMAAAAQFRIYCVPIHGGRLIEDPLSAPLDRTDSRASVRTGGKGDKKGGREDRSWTHYQTIADATGGAVIDVVVPQTELGLGYLVAPAKGGELAPLYEGGGPVNRILTRVLTDAINPKYSDRIEPIVKVLVAYCQGAAASVPEDRTVTHEAWDRAAAAQR